MDKKKIRERLPEPQPNKEQKADDTSINPAIGKPNVVRSPNEHIPIPAFHTNGSTITDKSMFAYTSRKTGVMYMTYWYEILDLLNTVEERPEIIERFTKKEVVS